jgi:molybdopterin-guanine dinucleotide biosynthesis protein B
LRDEPEWDLPTLLEKLSPVDVVLVEGFKRDPFPKIEIHRLANGKPPLYPDDPYIVAIASDTPLPQVTLPVIDLNDIERIVDALLEYAAPLPLSVSVLRSA